MSLLSYVILTGLSTVTVNVTYCIKSVTGLSTLTVNVTYCIKSVTGLSTLTALNQ